MKQSVSIPPGKVAAVGLGLAAFAAATGLAFAAWVDNGAGIFMTMVEGGLSWCF